MTQKAVDVVVGGEEGYMGSVFKQYADQDINGNLGAGTDLLFELADILLDQIP